MVEAINHHLLCNLIAFVRCGEDASFSTFKINKKNVRYKLYMHYLVEDMHVFITPLSQFSKAPSTYSKIERSVGGPTPELFTNFQSLF